ncbi:MAG: hypothetical protein M0C28_13050 [Candidatus Moduliflexus flocculans]|nr:hypothetical protein [Candidatus Moduliflexus flocculans]
MNKTIRPGNGRGRGPPLRPGLHHGQHLLPRGHGQAGRGRDRRRDPQDGRRRRRPPRPRPSCRPFARPGRSRSCPPPTPRRPRASRRRPSGPSRTR